MTQPLTEFVERGGTWDEIRQALIEWDCIVSIRQCMPATPHRYNPSAPERYFLRRRRPEEVMPTPT